MRTRHQIDGTLEKIVAVAISWARVGNPTDPHEAVLVQQMYGINGGGPHSVQFPPFPEIDLLLQFGAKVVKDRHRLIVQLMRCERPQQENYEEEDKKPDNPFCEQSKRLVQPYFSIDGVIVSSLHKNNSPS